MAPPSGLHQSALPSDFGIPFAPPLGRASTVPVSLASHADKSHLAPEDAVSAHSPPRRLAAFGNGGNRSGSEARPRRPRHTDGSRSRSRRRKRFQKLLWVKQSCRHRKGSLTGSIPVLITRFQTQTTIQIKQPSLRISSEIRGFSHTTSGR